MARDTYIRSLLSEQPVYRNEAVRLCRKLKEEATIDAKGVIRWNSNGSVPPEDCVALAAHIGLPINELACNEARDADFAAFMVEYRKRRANRTPEEIAEERAEARAAHGPGVTLVNVLTGEKYRT